MTISSAESNQFIISAGPSGEYLPIPGLTTKQCVPSNVSLRTPPVKHAAGTQAAIELNIPFVSAIMQSVSGPELAIGLARNGGFSFISGSQPITGQAEMVWEVKKIKAGFVASDPNLPRNIRWKTYSACSACRLYFGHSA